MNEDIFLKALKSIDEIFSGDVLGKDTLTRTVIKRETNTNKILEAYDKAEVFYEEIRNDADDVALISSNIGTPRDIVSRVKEHIFVRKHNIEINQILEFRRLDADPEIVNSWSRLREGDFVNSDEKLFRHEQVESILELRERITQTEAHRRTVALGYDWDPDEAYNGNSSNS